MTPSPWKVYWSIFYINLTISAFTFGGGYVVIPMMRKHYVERLKWITEEELTDMAAIAQSTPGAIAVNIAVVVGFRLKGILGAIVSGIATVLPPLIILSVISTCYTAFRDNHIISAVLKGMEAGVAAIIVDLVADMVIAVVKQKNLVLTLLVPLSFVASFVFHINVIFVILGCIVVCLLQALFLSRRKAAGHE